MSNPHQQMANWRKSRASTSNTACVEVGGSGEVAGIRDTKQDGMDEAERPALVVSKAAFGSFVNQIKSGRLD